MDVLQVILTGGLLIALLVSFVFLAVGKLDKYGMGAVIVGVSLSMGWYHIVSALVGWAIVIYAYKEHWQGVSTLRSSGLDGSDSD